MNSNYDTLILDVDGVILDSNTIKKQNIRAAAFTFADKNTLDAFVQYFISLNGVPRQEKVAKYFGEDSNETQCILAEYNRLNAENLLQVNLTDGLKEFLMRWNRRCTIYALSGGEQSEVRMVLEHNKIQSFFSAILGGPISKQAHIMSLGNLGKTLFIGDSKHDFLVAEEFGFEFIFMYQYSQFDNWKSFFKNQSKVLQIKNLTECP